MYINKVYRNYHYSFKLLQGASPITTFFFFFFFTQYFVIKNGISDENIDLEIALDAEPNKKFLKL